MGEFIKISKIGETYEEAIGECMVLLLDKCGIPGAQVYRDLRPEAIEFRDWILNSSVSIVSPGNSMVQVDCVFFLYGSDE